jgi:hypothetical protein
MPRPAADEHQLTCRAVPRLQRIHHIWRQSGGRDVQDRQRPFQFLGPGVPSAAAACPVCDGAGGVCLALGLAEEHPPSMMRQRESVRVGAARRIG